MYQPYRKRQNNWKKAVYVMVPVIIIAIGFIAYQNYNVIESVKPQQIAKKITDQASTMSSSSQNYLNQMAQESSSAINTITNTGNQPSVQSAPTNPQAIASEIHNLINQQREQNGLAPLGYDDRLAAIAEAHSQDMASNSYFGHNTPSGVGLAQRYSEGGVTCYGWSGENIAQVPIENEDSIPSKTVNAWMNSPEHRDNILKSAYQNEGIGIAISQPYAIITEDFC